MSRAADQKNVTRLAERADARQVSLGVGQVYAAQKTECRRVEPTLAARSGPVRRRTRIECDVRTAASSGRAPMMFDTNIAGVPLPRLRGNECVYQSVFACTFGHFKQQIGKLGEINPSSRAQSLPRRRGNGTRRPSQLPLFHGANFVPNIIGASPDLLFRGGDSCFQGGGQVGLD